jgi:ornithine decarboxylase
VDVILAGPTCDSMDILYEKTTYLMPDTTRIGERVFILTTGAYTQSYSSIYFNGFPPLSSYILK